MIFLSELLFPGDRYRPMRGWLGCEPGTNIVPYVDPPKPAPVTRSCETCSYREGQNTLMEARCAGLRGKPLCDIARSFADLCGPWATKYQRRLCD